ncbi:hypothetical protein Nepgr_026056 [Nepenthes gracilis]|uniref:Uncharacterized protein n=1 Tax=Nepenthes gracilis TaxID=150966 RepID=A0AAD3T648_NEPGR|nr:hypothetical protein Nepgr_026056 [Nepenthes gracilis]
MAVPIRMADLPELGGMSYGSGSLVFDEFCRFGPTELFHFAGMLMILSQSPGRIWNRRTIGRQIGWRCWDGMVVSPGMDGSPGLECHSLNCQYGDCSRFGPAELFHFAGLQLLNRAVGASFASHWIVNVSHLRGGFKHEDINTPCT